MLYAKFVNSSEFSTGAGLELINIVLGKGSLFKNWIDLNFYKNIISYFLIQHLNPLTLYFQYTQLLLISNQRIQLLGFI